MSADAGRIARSDQSAAEARAHARAALRSVADHRPLGTDQERGSAIDALLACFDAVVQVSYPPGQRSASFAFLCVALTDLGVDPDLVMDGTQRLTDRKLYRNLR